ncbi:hypothetical protein [Muricauda sp. MAR_2010_75]|uniref:hypothetical protein n=1 Tax=Allomuricauda sp. MAR_2010_75 TaxID=1250232 RepID=UPI00055C5573|nr:hypothetical protein [Muricauda sp. MAR_2010_75]
MAELKNHIWLNKDFPRETFRFLMDAHGIRTASKMLVKIVVDYADMRYRVKDLERRNKILKQELSIEKQKRL